MKNHESAPRAANKGLILLFSLLLLVGIAGAKQLSSNNYGVDVSQTIQDSMSSQSYSAKVTSALKSTTESASYGAEVGQILPAPVPPPVFVTQNLLYDVVTKSVSDVGELTGKGKVKLEVSNGGSTLFGTTIAQTTADAPYAYTALLDLSAINPFPGTILVKKTSMSPQGAIGETRTFILSTATTSSSGETSATLPPSSPGAGTSVSTGGTTSSITLSTTPSGEPQATVGSCAGGSVMIKFTLPQGFNLQLCGAGNSCAIFKNGQQVQTSVVVNPDSSVSYTITDPTCTSGAVYALKALDKEAPVLVNDQFTTPTNNPAFIASGSFTDGPASGATGIGSIEVLVNGISNGFAAVIAGAVSGTFTKTLTLAEGQNAIVEIAKDVAGNTAQFSKSVFLDTQLPVVTNNPAVAVTNNPILQLSGFVADPQPSSGLASFGINGVPVTPDAESAFTYQLTLTEGQNTITEIATDNAGNAGQSVKQVVLDTQLPGIVITSAVWTGLGVPGAIGFTATDNYGLASVKIDFGNGNVIVVPATGTSFAGSAPNTYAAGGTYTATVTPVDAAGNNGISKTIVVQIPLNSFLTTSTDPSTGIVTVNDPSGNMLATLPAGALAATDWNVDVTPGPNGGAIKVMGVTLPANTAKSVSLPDSNPSAQFLCIIDGPVDAAVQQLQQGSCITQGYQRKMKCAAPGATQSFSSFPDGIQRTFTCTRTGGRIKIDGLIHSIVVQWADADEDGIPDSVDTCPTAAGPAQYQGCPFADLTIVDLHIIDQKKTGVCGFKPDGKPRPECKQQLPGITVKVFDRADANFVSIFGKRPSRNLLDNIYNSGIGQISSCVTGNDGSCYAGEPFGGKFLVIAKYVDPATKQTVYTGKFKNFKKLKHYQDDDEDDDDDNDGTTVQKNLLTKKLHIDELIKKDGSVKYEAGFAKIVQGSRLEIWHPEYTVWDSTKELYPFVFLSNDTWDVNVCMEVPQGYSIQGVMDENGDIIASNSCVQTLVAGESKIFVYDLVETGSPEPNTGFTLTTMHNGVSETKNVEIQGIRAKNEPMIEKEVNAKIAALKNSRTGSASSAIMTFALLLMLFVAGVLLFRRIRQNTP